MTFFTELKPPCDIIQKRHCDAFANLKVFFVWRLKMQFSFLMQLLCNSRSAQLIFPSCLTLRGLELEVSQLKNVEAEERKWVEFVERIDFEGRKTNVKQLLPTTGWSYFKFSKQNFMLLLTETKLPYFSKQNSAIKIPLLHHQFLLQMGGWPGRSQPLYSFAKNTAAHKEW